MVVAYSHLDTCVTGEGVFTNFCKILKIFPDNCNHLLSTVLIQFHSQVLLHSTLTTHWLTGPGVGSGRCTCILKRSQTENIFSLRAYLHSDRILDFIEIQFAAAATTCLARDWMTKCCINSNSNFTNCDFAPDVYENCHISDKLESRVIENSVEIMWSDGKISECQEMVFNKPPHYKGTGPWP